MTILRIGWTTLLTAWLTSMSGGSASGEALGVWCEDQNEVPMQLAIDCSKNNLCEIVTYTGGFDNPNKVISEKEKDVGWVVFETIRNDIESSQGCGPNFILPSRITNYLSAFDFSRSFAQTLDRAAQDANVESEFSFMNAAPIFTVYEAFESEQDCRDAEHALPFGNDMIACPKISEDGALDEPLATVAEFGQENGYFLGNQARHHLVLVLINVDWIEYEAGDLIDVGLFLGDYHRAKCNLQDESWREVMKILEGGIILVGVFDGVPGCESRKELYEEYYIVVVYEDGQYIEQLSFVEELD